MSEAPHPRVEPQPEAKASVPRRVRTRRPPSRGKHASRPDGNPDNLPTRPVPVPQSGPIKVTNPTKVLDTVIPITGWGSGLSLRQVPIDTPHPTFTISASSYVDLVDAEWALLQSREPKEGKLLPRTVFRYYCAMLWWHRALQLKKANSFVLSQQEKAALSVFSEIDDLWIPVHIAQYLSSMGNFNTATDVFYFQTLSYSDFLMESGYFGEGTNGVASDHTIWLYADLPVPGIFANAICVELDRSRSRNSTATVPLPNVDPKYVPKGAKTLPTTNILGYHGRALSDLNWSYAPSPAALASLRNLGWGLEGGNFRHPGDMCTHFKISVSTLQFVSGLFGQFRLVKCYPSGKCFAGANGSAAQATLLSPDYPSTLVDYAGRYSYLQNLTLQSRESIVDSMVTPAFAFGFRLLRSRVFDSFGADGTVRYHNRSSAQPWKFVDDLDSPSEYYNPTGNYLLGMNASMQIGNQSVLNALRKTTVSFRRADVLPSVMECPQST